MGTPWILLLVLLFGVQPHVPGADGFDKARFLSHLEAFCQEQELERLRGFSDGLKRTR